VSAGTRRAVLWALLAIACGASAASAAGPTPFAAPAAPDPRLSRREVAELVRSLGELMATGYVDSTLGASVQRKLAERLRAGAYAKLDRPRPLVAQLVSDVQALISDGHFNILYFPPQAPGFKWVSSEEGPPDEESQLEEARARLRSQNFGVVRAEVREGNIGWLTLARFDAPLPLLREPLAAAFDLLRNTDALILDLRKNPGGNPECVQLAFSYFLDGPPELGTSTYNRSRHEREDFWTPSDPGGARYLGRPVYVLTSAATASGGEMFSYQMKHRGKGTIVGQRTAGAAHSFDTYRLGGERIGNVMVLLPDARIIDGLTQGDWETTGVAPDVECTPDQAPEVATRLALEALLARATDEAARRAYRDLLDKQDFVARHGEPTAAELEPYVGRYGIRRVYVEDGRLRIQRESGPPVDLQRVADDTFELNIAMSPKPRVRFELEDGRARAMRLNLPDGEERIEREP